MSIDNKTLLMGDDYAVVAEDIQAFLQDPQDKNLTRIHLSSGNLLIIVGDFKDMLKAYQHGQKAQQERKEKKK